MVAGIRLDVGPVSNVEDLIHSMPPFLSREADTAIVSLSLEILSVQCMTFWVVNNILKSSNMIQIGFSSNYTTAEALICSVRHWTLACSFNKTTFALLAICSHGGWRKIELAVIVWVSWITLVGCWQFLSLLLYGCYTNTFCFVNVWVESKAGFAVLAVECVVD